MTRRKIPAEERRAEILSIRIFSATRAHLEHFADQEGVTIAEAARQIIDEGMRARGIEC